MRKILFVIIAVILIASVYLATGGVRVRVKNVGSGTISKLQVQVTGETYELGDLDPGESKSVLVKAKGESGAGLAYAGRADHVFTIKPIGYFEPGSYRGEIYFEIDGSADKPIHQESKITLGLW